MKKYLTKLIAVILCISLINIPVFPVGAEVDLIVVEEDFTKYSSLNDIPNFVNTENEHTTISVVNGTGLVLEQVKSTPINSAGDSYNVEKSSAIAHIIEGVFNENAEKRTSYRIDRYAGKYKITMDFEILCDKYAEAVDGVSINNPYYEFNFANISAASSLTTSTSAGKRLHMRMYETSTVVYDPSNKLATANTVKYTSGEPHQMVIDVDTATKAVSVNIDGYKTPASGDIKSAGYINAFNLTSMERMLVGSKFVIKKIRIEQTEADAATTAALTALESITDPAADPYAVTGDVTLSSVDNVTWSTSDADVITATGKVTRGDVGTADKEVTLTATYKNGDMIIYKDYDFTVKSYSASEIAAMAVGAIDLKLGSEVTEDINLPLTAENGTTFTWVSNNTAVVTNDGKVTQAKDDTTVILTVTGTYGNQTATRTFDVFVPGTGVSEPLVGGIAIEEDFTQYSSLEEIPNFINTDNEHTTVSVVKGTGIVIEQIKSTPLNSEGSSYNTNKSSAIAHIISGVFNKNDESRTSYRIDRYAGEYKITLDFDLICEKYPDNKYNGIGMSNPYFEFNVLGTASSSALAITEAKNSRLSLRMYGASTSLYDPSSPLGTVKYTAGESHQMVIDVDTASKDISMNIDGYKTPASGQIKKTGYINSFTLYSMERTIVGSKFIVKKIKIEQTAEDAATTAALEALEAITAPSATPYEVKENVTIGTYDNIKWSTSDPDVIDLTGKVTRGMEDEDVTLTATYTNGDVILYKDYVLTVKAYTADEIAKADVEAINLDIKEKVTKNISLPLTGTNGTTFEWVSSHPEVVSNTGKVTQAEGEDTTVTLTVTGTYGGKTHTRIFTLFVPKKGVSGEVIPTVDKLIYVEEDFTNYSSINEIPYFVYDKTTHANIEILPGRGLAITQTKSTPLTEGVDAEGGATFSVNKEQVPNIAHVIEGKFNADDEKRTVYTINRYAGKYRMTVDYEVKADIYEEPLEGITISSPYYPFYFGTTPEPSALTSTITNSFALFTRISRKSASILGSVGSNAFTNSIKYTEGEPHQMVVDFDTLTKETTVNVDNYKTPAKGYLGKPGYINTFYIAGMERMKVGSYFIIKKITFQQLEEDENITKALNALDSIPDFIDDPFAVTGDLTLPTDNDKITWSTSDESVVTAKGKVKRWYADRDAVLTATYTDYDTVVSKKFTITVKELDEYKKTELLTKSGNALTDFEQVCDLSKGSASVSEKGITVVKKVSGSNADEGDLPVYYADYPLYKESVAYDETTKASVLSTGYSGIYDISFKVTPSITGDKPVYIALGSNDKVFAQAVALSVEKNGIYISYDKGIYKVVEEDTTGKTYNVTFRVDTDQKRVWIYVDGDLAGSYFEFSQCEIVDTLRIILDENNAQNDQVVINDIKLIQIVENLIDVKQTLINVFKKLTVDMVAANPDSVDSLEKLPESIGGYRIKWVSNNKIVDVETGAVYHGLSGEYVTVSAIINSEGIYVKKDFRLFVRAAATGDEKVDYYLSDIKEAITNQNAEDIRYDINLPSQHSGIAIIWTSSKPNILGTDGKINKNIAITEPTEVILTASVTVDGSNYTRPYTYKVTPRAYENVIFTSNNAPESFTINGVDNVAVAGTTITNIKFNQAGNGNITLSDSKGKDIVVVNISNGLYNITYGSNVTMDYPIGLEKTVDLKVMVMPDIDKVAIWADGLLIVDCGDTMNQISDIASVDVVGGINVTETSVIADEYAMLDINVANAGYFDVFAKNVVNEDITLVNSTIIPADVLWTSTDDSLINVVTGAVAEPAQYKFVDITLTLTSRNDSNVKRVITKKIAVACADSLNFAKGVKISTTGTPKSGYYIENAVDGKLDTVYATAYANRKPVIKLDFGKETYVNTLYVNEDFTQYDKGIESYTVSYSNDGTNWTVAKTGTITGADSALISFDTVHARYISLTVEECATSSLYINELEAYLYAEPSELVKLDVEQIDLNLGYSVSSDITLPVNGQFGTTFSWVSDNTAVISSTGKVTQPANDTTVTLTVTGAIGNYTYSKSIMVYVAGKTAIGATPVGGGAGGGGGGGAGGGASASQLPGFVETEITPAEDVVNSGTAFGDMDSTHWAYENVSKLKELGIVDGDENGNFNPSGKVTREQFLKMLVVATNVDTNVENVEFADVDSSKWYAVYVAAGVNAGLVNGMTEDTFGVGANIARQDMAVMIARILNSKNINVTQTSEVFDDDDDVSSYAIRAVYLVRDAGIIQGYNNKFNPKDSLTRAEAATVIIKMLELLK